LTWSRTVIESLSSTQLVNIVIGVTLLEAAALAAFFYWTGRGVPPSQFLLNLVSGLALMIGLRGAITGQPVGYLVACLAVSGVVHGVDLWLRWRR
jgi:hypothetical protein